VEGRGLARVDPLRVEDNPRLDPDNLLLSPGVCVRSPMPEPL